MAARTLQRVFGVEVLRETLRDVCNRSAVYLTARPFMATRSP
jgi:hypothetical protein